MWSLKILFLLAPQYLQFCDQVILLEDGKICEQGAHSELMQKKGRYAHLIQMMHGEATQVIRPRPRPSPSGRNPLAHSPASPRTHSRRPESLRWAARPSAPSRRSLWGTVKVRTLGPALPGSGQEPPGLGLQRLWGGCRRSVLLQSISLSINEAQRGCVTSPGCTVSW